MAVKSFLAISCTHRPVSDPAYCKWVIKQVGKRQPDVLVHLGDLFDLKCLSRFDVTGASSLQAEYDSANEFLGLLREASPKSSRVYLMGNHCARVFRESHALLSEVMDFRKHVPELRRWETYPYTYRPDCVHRIGQVTFAHGFSTSVGAMKREVLNLAVANGLYVHGHLHRGGPPQQVVAGSLALPYWRVDAGCGIRSEEPYFQAWDTSQWSRGLVSGWVDTKLHADSLQHWGCEFVQHSRFWT